MKAQLFASLSLIISAATADRAWSQCAEKPPQSDFEKVEIAKAPGTPYDMAIAKDGRVFWVERHGYFRVWNPTTKAVTLIKKIPTFASKSGGTYDGAVETGLDGLVLAPDFETSHWVYIFYAVPIGSTSSGAMGPMRRLSRFTLKNNDTELDDASEKVIHEHQSYAQCCHFGGALDWGPGGVLYFSTGDNTHYNTTGSTPWGGSANKDPRTTSSNTNDPRGKILRIIPIPFPDAEKPAWGLGRTYTVPSGNLKEVWDTPEKDKVLPEIFSMGHRNPFTISVHSVKGWIGIGEANGDNGSQGDDEINIATKPGNFGWPYLLGDNKAYITGFWSGKFDPEARASALPNDGPGNTGAKVLPPAVGSQISVKHGKRSMPINCHGVAWGWVEPPTVAGGKVHSWMVDKLIVGGYGGSDARIATVDGSGNVTALDVLWTSGFAPNNVMRVTQGPDGAFYVANGVACCNFSDNLSGAAVSRISYKGTTCLATTAVRSPAAQRAARDGHLKLAHVGSTQVELPAGMKRAEAYDMAGKQVWNVRRADATANGIGTIPSSVAQGMLEVRYFAN